MTFKSPIATCPRCNSQSIQAVTLPKKSINVAILGELALGTAAGLAASSETVIQNVCLHCGQQWFPGSKDEEHIRTLSGERGVERQREAEIQRKEKLEDDLWKSDRNTGYTVLGGILGIVILIAGVTCAA